MLSVCQLPPKIAFTSWYAINKPRIIQTNNIINPLFIISLKDFGRYLSQNYANLKNLEEEFTNSIYKLFGWVMGNVIGSYIVYVKNNNNKDLDQVLKLEKLLTGEV